MPGTILTDKLFKASTTLKKRREPTMEKKLMGNTDNYHNFL